MPNLLLKYVIKRTRAGQERMPCRFLSASAARPKINDLTFITDEMVNVARSTLVIGAT